MPNIFLVEDDRAIAKNLTLLLRSEGFSVIHAPTREEALTALAGDPFDLALIDISLPDGNGFTVYTEIKAAREIPVIFLTASGDEASVVTGLNMGADDYITKPFRPRELVARIKTALRKTGRSPAAFNVCELRVDTSSGVVKKEGREIFLSALEYRLLLVFVNNPPKHPHAGPPAGRAVGRRRRVRQRQHPDRLHQAPARKDRGRPRQPADHPDRPRDGIPPGRQPCFGIGRSGGSLFCLPRSP